MKPEQLLAKRVSNYLLTKHPNVPFRFDVFADLRMAVHAAKKLHSLHGAKFSKGYPDLFIASGRGSYCGLFVELKSGNKIPDNEHTRTQASYHKVLRYNGYKVEFALNYDESVKIIKKYLKKKRKKV